MRARRWTSTAPPTSRLIARRCQSNRPRDSCLREAENSIDPVTQANARSHLARHASVKATDAAATAKLMTHTSVAMEAWSTVPSQFRSTAAQDQHPDGVALLAPRGVEQPLRDHTRAPTCVRHGQRPGAPEKVSSRAPRSGQSRRLRTCRAASTSRCAGLHRSRRYWYPHW